VKTLILCDERLPLDVKKRLGDFGDLLEMASKEITYAAISGHTDIFCCRVGGVLVVSPALPLRYFKLFDLHGITWVYGCNPNGFDYPDSAIYNAVVTPSLLIHNLSITDPVIKELAGVRKKIQVNQGYTRCNLLPLPNDVFITSDRGIFAVLVREGFEVLYVSPNGILLEGFPHGFIGGVCGVFGDQVFMAGSLAFYEEGQRIKDFLSLHKLTLIELYDGSLVDGGSILFI
jgi:hypothetical protein